jgi:type I restriction-modification system DNA methylase subunit
MAKGNSQKQSNGSVLDFSLSASNGERAGVRCRVRSSPVNNANYAWIQHFTHHLSPVGVVGFVLANGSMMQGIESVIEKHGGWQLE